MTSEEIKASRPSGTHCAQCGFDVKVDEDGCCLMCGADAMGEGADAAHLFRSDCYRLQAENDQLKQNDQDLSEAIRELQAENERFRQMAKVAARHAELDAKDYNSMLAENKRLREQRRAWKAAASGCCVCYPGRVLCNHCAAIAAARKLEKEQG